MTRSAIIRGLRRAILQRTAKEHRRELQTLLAALEDQFATVMEETSTNAYQEGAKAERARLEQQYAGGFDLGYKHGLERALGSVGQPARRLDDDELLVPTS